MSVTPARAKPPKAVRAIGVIYTVGYWLTVASAAHWYWPHSTGRSDFIVYVMFQMFYALFWPLILLFEIIGTLR